MMGVPDLGVLDNAKVWGAVTAVVTALAGAVVFLFKYVIAEHRRQMNDMKTDRDSSRKMLFDLLDIAETTANRKRQAAGKPPIALIPSVVPEHGSPVSPGQLRDANRETLKARIAAIGRELDVPLRSEDEQRQDSR